MHFLVIAIQFIEFVNLKSIRGLICAKIEVLIESRRMHEHISSLVHFLDIVTNSLMLGFIY